MTFISSICTRVFTIKSITYFTAVTYTSIQFMNYIYPKNLLLSSSSNYIYAFNDNDHNNSAGKKKKMVTVIAAKEKEKEKDNDNTNANTDKEKKEKKDEHEKPVINDNDDIDYTKVKVELDDTCPLCKFMRESPCGKEWSMWETCVQYHKERDEDYVTFCSDFTMNLASCIDQNKDEFPEEFTRMVGGSSSSTDDNNSDDDINKEKSK